MNTGRCIRAAGPMCGQCSLADGAFDAPYGAPTAGPPPYQPYEIRPAAVFSFVNDSALGPSSTCWRF